MDARKRSEVAQREVRWYSVQREWRWAWWLPWTRLFRGFDLSLWDGVSLEVFDEETGRMLWRMWIGNLRNLIRFEPVGQWKVNLGLSIDVKASKISEEDSMWRWERERVDILTFLCQSLKEIPKRNFCKNIHTIKTLNNKHRFPMSRFRFYRKEASKNHNDVIPM